MRKSHFLRALALPVAAVAALTLSACSEGPTVPASPSASPFADVLPGSQVIQVPGDYATIQAAVDAATEGATIQVRAGTYAERVVITKSGLRLHASAGVVLDGATVGGTGIHVLGTATQPVTGVEIDGFEVANFWRGIVVQWGIGARVHRNEVHHSEGDLIPPLGSGEASGIQLAYTTHSEVSQNQIHHNAEDGIQVRFYSSENVVKGNKIFENGHGRMATLMGSGIFLTGPEKDHQILENEVVGNFGYGIRMHRPVNDPANPSPPMTGIRVAQNRLHGNWRSGISLMGNVAGNTIEQNDARGNNLSGLAPCYQCNMVNMNGVNHWARNLGTFNLTDPTCLGTGGPM